MKRLKRKKKANVKAAGVGSFVGKEEHEHRLTQGTATASHLSSVYLVCMLACASLYPTLILLRTNSAEY